jgi:hypothetical protein
MSVTYIPAEVRRLVVARAEGVCEYCLIAGDDRYYGCEADHIISEKQGSGTDAENLAYACVCVDACGVRYTIGQGRVGSLRKCSDEPQSVAA